MSNLTKKLAGAYDEVECVGIVSKSVKYCEDNTIGSQPMIDFFNNKLSIDTPIINDMHSTLSIGDEVDVVNDVIPQDEYNAQDELVEIANLLVRTK